ncbi:hypothetical protein GGI15_001879 [Coemansia interrupta]|uniref:AAA+ ATPase domain-containing protein n=1 Tax=Coemansia interrupta TaxID=1126814 RepID=A0A9W8HNK2_9FUNG|nr:hypothetical protein GGI15_001879 [Coemansia interrupta]
MALAHDTPLRAELPGLEAPFAALLEMVEYPTTHAAHLARLHVQAPGGVLLHGPAGCGKTHLVRQVAGHAGAPLVVVAGPAVVSAYAGESERLLREHFALAQAQARAAGRPSILFLDEIDSIAGARQAAGEQTARLVAQLLTLMDGMAGRGGVVVVGATNRADALDAALRRPGRFDREIHVAPPDAAARLRILRHCSRAMPLHAGVDLALLADAPTGGWVAADLAALCAAAAGCAAERPQPGPPHVTMADFARALAAVAPAARRQQTGGVGAARWADVQGLQDVALRLRQAVEWPVARAAAMRRLGVRPPRGVLLHGPPGCSKTTLVRALAGESRAAFFALSGAAVYSAFVGESERRVREAFAQARAARPAVVFLDEIDAMVGRRGGAGGGGGGGGDEVRERVVATLLNEMDGVDAAAGDGGVLVVAATNRVDLVDAALLRPGRFDRVLYVPPPDVQARADILRARVAAMPAAAAVDVAALARRTAGFSGADLANLCREAAMAALRRGVECGASGSAAVEMSDFERALAVVPASLTADVLRFYAGIEREYA